MNNARLRTTALSSAIRLEVLTIVWVIIESVIAIYSGIKDHSISLVAFGIDSIVDVLSAVTLLWRLRLEFKGSSVDVVNAAENKAAWITGSALSLLCLYIVIEAILGLLNHHAAETSPTGLGVSSAAFIIMIVLGFRKRRLAKELEMPSLRADADFSLIDAYMAGIIVLGLAMNALSGWWWMDSILSLSLLLWLIPETKEAFESTTAKSQ